MSLLTIVILIILLVVSWVGLGHYITDRHRKSDFAKYYRSILGLTTKFQNFTVTKVTQNPTYVYATIDIVSGKWFWEKTKTNVEIYTESELHMPRTRTMQQTLWKYLDNGDSIPQEPIQLLSDAFTARLNLEKVKQNEKSV